jgi:hypothetical protein
VVMKKVEVILTRIASSLLTTTMHQSSSFPDKERAGTEDNNG